MHAAKQIRFNRNCRRCSRVPALCQHPGLFHRVEDLSIEELTSELGVEALAVAVLPGRAGFDIQRLCSGVCQPLSQILGEELRSVIGADMLWHSLGGHDIGQRPDHLAELQVRSGRINRHSRVCSSIRFSTRILRPSCVRTLTKSSYRPKFVAIGIRRIPGTPNQLETPCSHRELHEQTTATNKLGSRGLLLVRIGTLDAPGETTAPERLIITRSQKGRDN
jgi:hypothetical protein